MKYRNRISRRITSAADEAIKFGKLLVLKAGTQPCFGYEQLAAIKKSCLSFNSVHLCLHFRVGQYFHQVLFIWQHSLATLTDMAV
jgi:hypothetical protein